MCLYHNNNNRFSYSCLTYIMQCSVCTAGGKHQLGMYASMLCIIQWVMMEELNNLQSPFSFYPLLKIVLILASFMFCLYNC